MKNKKIGQFIKKYSFYLAVSAISVVAIIAMFILPKGEGNVKDIPNSYADNKQADGSVNNNFESNVTAAEDKKDKTSQTEDKREYLEKDSVVSEVTQTSEPEKTESKSEKTKMDDDQDEMLEVTDSDLNQETDLDNDEQSLTQNVEEISESTQSIETQNVEEQITDVAEVETETFESTTVSVTDEPFFADGDKFNWPVEGEVVVPYTDNSTTHWFSESLNYTMRTFGVCISAPQDTDVIAVAKGRVLEVIEDSSNAFGTDTPYIGKAVVVDHGNGYKTIYGFQGGVVSDDLVGQVVNQGDVIGKVGLPKGAFVEVGSNIYLQVKHNDKIVNPIDYLSSDSEEENRVDSVDVGFSQ